MEMTDDDQLRHPNDFGRCLTSSSSGDEDGGMLMSACSDKSISQQWKLKAITSIESRGRDMMWRFDSQGLIETVKESFRNDGAFSTVAMLDGLARVGSLQPLKIQGSLERRGASYFAVQTVGSVWKPLAILPELEVPTSGFLGEMRLGRNNAGGEDSSNTALFAFRFTTGTLRDFNVGNFLSFSQWQLQLSYAADDIVGGDGGAPSQDGARMYIGGKATVRVRDDDPGFHCVVSGSVGPTLLIRHRSKTY